MLTLTLTWSHPLKLPVISYYICLFLEARLRASNGTSVVARDGLSLSLHQSLTAGSCACTKQYHTLLLSAPCYLIAVQVQLPGKGSCARDRQLEAPMLLLLLLLAPASLLPPTSIQPSPGTAVFQLESESAPQPQRGGSRSAEGRGQFSSPSAAPYCSVLVQAWAQAKLWFDGPDPTHRPYVTNLWDR